MKKVILFLIAVPVLVSGQVKNNFETGIISDWTQGTEGHWKADTIHSISGRFSLHHVFDNSSSGTDCIGLRLKDIHPDEGKTHWSFRIRYGCDPSGSNNWSVYLFSDRDPGSFGNGAGVNGYAAGINLTGYDDSLRIWKIRNGFASVIATCPVNWQTDIGINIPAEIIVDRTVEGEWTISAYTGDNILKGTSKGFDRELFSSSWFVINYRYTSSRDMLLWFDDLSVDGIFYEDISPPAIVKCSVSGKQSVTIYLSEEPSEEFLLPSDFSLNGEAVPSVKIDKISTVNYRIFFSSEFINKMPNHLFINRLCDKNNNCSNNIDVAFIPVWAEPGDVIISEIMADPIPAVDLPPREYIELHNRTEFKIDLGKWKLSDGSQTIGIPASVINPGENIILCPASDTSLFIRYGKTIGIRTFPVLTDGGKLLILSDSTGNLIHGLEYSSSWYDDILKAEGGWSLEMTDTDYPFYYEGNWRASDSRSGGTPGKNNSVGYKNIDTYFRGIINAYPVNSTTIDINFSEPLIGLQNQGMIISPGNNEIVSLTPSDPLRRSFRASVTDPMEINVIYTINLTDDISDFAGNKPENGSFSFGIPSDPRRGELVFNEILFNPFPGNPDYIELYNRSDKIFNASEFCLASVNTENGDTSEVKALSYENRCILPQSYYVVTTGARKVCERYISSDPDVIHESAQMPSMPDDKGHLLLFNRRKELIDEVIYSEKMHFPLLADREGIALEKIRPDLDSDESSSWYSASEDCGWGTPGRANSVFINDLPGDDRLKFSSERISPDSDGFEDLLVIDLDLSGLGNILSVTVFDEGGHYVRKVCKNLFTADKATVVWDGCSDSGSRVREGIYIVLVETFNDKGKTKSWKKVCAVVY